MKLIKLLPLCILTALISISGPSSAQEEAINAASAPAEKAFALKPLAELYTSQHCSRCPKGNQQFAEFADNSDLIGLTFSVDYWDFMGSWKDTFAQQSFSDRQKLLNTHIGRRGPYTPQVIFNGDGHCSAVKKKKLEKQFSKIDVSPSEIQISYDGEMLNLSGNTDPVEIWVVDYEPGITFATPKGGQNSNKTMSYFNRATRLDSAGVISEAGGQLTAKCDSHCAIIFQHPNHGTVLGAISHSVG